MYHAYLDYSRHFFSLIFSRKQVLTFHAIPCKFSPQERCTFLGKKKDHQFVVFSRFQFKDCFVIFSIIIYDKSSCT